MENNYNLGGILQSLAPIAGLIPGAGTAVGAGMSLAGGLLGQGPSSPSTYQPLTHNTNKHGYNNGGTMNPDSPFYKAILRRIAEKDFAMTPEEFTKMPLQELENLVFANSDQAGSKRKFDPERIRQSASILDNYVNKNSIPRSDWGNTLKEFENDYANYQMGQDPSAPDKYKTKSYSGQLLNIARKLGQLPGNVMDERIANSMPRQQGFQGPRLEDYPGAQSIYQEDMLKQQEQIIDAGEPQAQVSFEQQQMSKNRRDSRLKQTQDTIKDAASLTQYTPNDFIPGEGGNYNPNLLKAQDSKYSGFTSNEDGVDFIINEGKLTHLWSISKKQWIELF